MTAPVENQLFADRERRILLWLCVAAACWRWLLAVRTPLPCPEAAIDLWVAGKIAGGDFGVLGEVWLGPWWSAVLAPALWLGCDPVESAQVIACVVAALALVPVACAAETAGRGAGLAAAMLLFTLPEPTLAAAGGAATGLQLLLAGAALWCGAAGRPVVGVALGAVAVADAARGGWLGLLPLGLLAVALVAALALARLPLRLRDLVLTGAVGLMFYLSWSSVERPEATVERHLGELVGERLPPEQTLVTELPRVAYYAGRRPMQVSDIELLERLRADTAGAAVLYRSTAGSLPEPLRLRFGRFELSPKIEDLANKHGVAVWFRR